MCSKELQEKARQVAALRKADRVKDVKLHKMASSRDKERVRAVDGLASSPCITTAPHQFRCPPCLLQMVLKRKLEKAQAQLKRAKSQADVREKNKRAKAATASARGNALTMVWTGLPDGSRMDETTALEETFHLTRVEDTGHHVPRVLAVALQESVNKRWKRQRLDTLLDAQIQLRKQKSRQLHALVQAGTSPDGEASEQEATLRGAVQAATARISAIQELQLRLRADDRGARSSQAWASFVRDEKAGKHAIAWLVRCLARMADAQCAVSRCEQRVAQLQVECSKLRRENEAKSRAMDIAAAKAQIEHEERILLMLEHSLQATAPADCSADHVGEQESKHGADDASTAAASGMPSVAELMNQLDGHSDNVGKLERLNAALQDAQHEADTLRAELEFARASAAHLVGKSTVPTATASGAAAAAKKTKKKRRPAKAADAADNNGDDDGGDDDWELTSGSEWEDNDSDSDWEDATARRARTKKRTSRSSRNRNSSGSAASSATASSKATAASKASSGSSKSGDGTALPGDLASEIDALLGGAPRRDSDLSCKVAAHGTAHGSAGGCKCGGKCIRGCPCKKSGAQCGEHCGCTAAKCTNGKAACATDTAPTVDKQPPTAAAATAANAGGVTIAVDVDSAAPAKAAKATAAAPNPQRVAPPPVPASTTSKDRVGAVGAKKVFAAKPAANRAVRKPLGEVNSSSQNVSASKKALASAAKPKKKALFSHKTKQVINVVKRPTEQQAKPQPLAE